MLAARGWLSQETFAFHTEQCDTQRNSGSPQAQQNGSKLQQIPDTQLQINPCTGFPIPSISSVHGSKGAIRNVGTLTPKTNKKFQKRIITILRMITRMIWIIRLTARSWSRALRARDKGSSGSSREARHRLSTIGNSAVTTEKSGTHD